MNIVDFLMNNIGFVIVIGGFLLTMLSRKRAAESKDTKNRMPTFGGGPSDKEPGQWMPGRKSTENTASERRMETTRVEQTEVYNRTEGTQPQSAASTTWTRPDRIETVRTDVIERGGLVLASNQAAEADQLAVNRNIANTTAAEIAYADEVRRGVIWAEILGPPRAKQPYSRRK